PSWLITKPLESGHYQAVRKRVGPYHYSGGLYCHPSSSSFRQSLLPSLFLVFPTVFTAIPHPRLSGSLYCHPSPSSFRQSFGRNPILLFYTNDLSIEY
ncbi:hypothetical protein, partial [Paraglaciecola arctica]|uniref:hypothetical protein n=1 Tax=Paraglaciecola arctica TaxID=1128911 RepID=UPI001C07BE79